MFNNNNISVCIATYNGENYIKEQLDSILSQLGKHDEVIISDDGSTDRTLEIVEMINDSRIKIYHSSFRNVILNFENALGKATGDIIFLSDQDDIWYPNKVAEVVKLLESHDLVFSNLSVFSDDLSVNYPLFDVRKSYDNLVNNFIKNHCVGATMAFKSKLLKYILPIPKGIEMHDIWIYFISSIYGKTCYYKNPLVYYRRHDSNVSNTGEKTNNSLFKIAMIRATWLLAILKRVIKITFAK